MSIQSSGRWAVKVDLADGLFRSECFRKFDPDLLRIGLVSNGGAERLSAGGAIQVALKSDLLLIVVWADEVGFLGASHNDEADRAGNERDECENNSVRPEIARGLHESVSRWS